MRLAAVRELGAPGRLLHVLLGGCEGEHVVAEVCLAAQTLAERGHLTAAEDVLRQGLRVLQAGGDLDGDRLIALLGLWVHVALEQRASLAIDRLLWELPSLHEADPRVARIEQLLRGALATLHWTGRALTLMAEVPPFQEPELELARMEVCVDASRHVSVDDLGVVLKEGARVVGLGSPSGRRRLASWLARRAYARERYDPSARLRMRAVRGEIWASRRFRELLRAAINWVEVAEFDRASACVETVLRELVPLRLPTLEGDALWTQRTIAWRRGLCDEVDEELADLASKVDPRVGRLMLFHEATLAWAHRNAFLFKRFYDRVVGLAGQNTALRTLALLEAMAVDLGVYPVAPALTERRITELGREVPGIALQVMALSRGAVAPDEAMLRAARDFAERTRCPSWHLRLDVLSVSESLARLGVQISR